MNQRPTMLGSCARAASAQEARFRIDAPIAGPRSVGVVALDPRAALIVGQVQQEPWSRARFYRPAGMSWAGVSLPTGTDTTGNGAGSTLGVGNGHSQGNGHAGGNGGGLWAVDGQPAAVADIVKESDVVVMVATDASAAGPGGAVGDAAAGSGVMTVGVVLAEPAETQAVVTAMRPHTRMLMVSKDDGDVPEVLRALRA